MTKLSFEERIDRSIASKIRRDEKNADKLAKREEVAAKMIGELNSGKSYIFPVGGKYREGTRYELIAYLIKNGYA